MSKNEKHGLNDIRVAPLSEHVRRNPTMYWGKEDPNESDAVEAMVEQLETLNSKDLFSVTLTGWNVVGSSSDWVQSGLSSAPSIRELFTKSWGFPEGGINSLRSEFFVFLLASDVALWRNGELILIKGDCANLDEDMLREQFPDKVLIAFRGNDLEK